MTAKPMVTTTLPPVRFTIFRDAALAALDTVIGIVPKNSTLPILATVRVTATRGNAVEFVATNLETMTVTTTSGQVVDAGAFCVDAVLLRRIVKEWPDDAIELFLDVRHSQLYLSQTANNGLTYKLPAQPAAEFPMTPAPPNARATLDIGRGELRRLLSDTLYAAATGGDRPTLNSVSLHIEPDGALYTVATDSFRLSLRRSTAALRGLKDVTLRDVTVPAAAVKYLITVIDRAASDAAEMLRLHLPERYSSDAAGINSGLAPLHIEMGQTRVLVTPREDAFPNFMPIIPEKKALEHHLIVDGAALRQALAAVAPLGAPHVSLSYEDGQLTVYASVFGVGAVAVPLDAHASRGKAVDVGLATNFLTDALRRLPGDAAVCLAAQDGRSPVIVGSDPLDPRHDDVLQVIMPVQDNNGGAFKAADIAVKPPSEPADDSMAAEEAPGAGDEAGDDETTLSVDDAMTLASPE